MKYEKILEAVNTLKRAAEAAMLSQQYPHSRELPCRHQQEAARAELACAEKLIAEAKEINPKQNYL